MKRLLLPLLAALALPTSVNAESYWLILRYGSKHVGHTRIGGASLEKIEMQDLNQCETEGEKWIRTKLPKGENQTILAYHCLVGK